MKIGVLWFPAWASTEDDLHEMMQYLKLKGVDYKSINLKGHNTQPIDLHKITHNDWLKQAEEAYLEVSKNWDCVFVGGLSMGGQLALYIASKYPVQGIISVGTPLRLKIPFIIKLFTYIIQHIPILIHRRNHLLDKRIQTIALSRKGAYKYFPLSSVAQVLFLTAKVRQIYLRKIKSPIILIQSTTDHIVPSNNLDLFKRIIQTPIQDIQTMWVKDSYHLVNLDHSRFEVFDAIYDFILKYSIIKEYNN